MQEDESTEFKEIVVDGIKKEVVSFANTRGGTLYIGIKDDGTVEGWKMRTLHCSRLQT